MKNILTAVFLLGFLGISFGVFAQNLRLLNKNLPCINQNFAKYGTYKLYLEAREPDFVNNTNLQTISIVPMISTYNITLGIVGVGGQSGEKIQYSGSPTGWVYAVTVRMGGLSYTPGNIPPPFVVEEVDPSTGISHKKTIYLKRKDVIAPVVDIKVLESDLCTGTITVEAITNSAIGGFEYSHELYDWSFNGSVVASTVNNNTDKSTVTLNVGGAINNNFSISVLVKSLYTNAVTPTVCASKNYTKSFNWAVAAAPTTFNKKGDATKYCRGANNEFFIETPTTGIEYRWTFDANGIDTDYDEQVAGLNLTSFVPDFGKNNTVYPSGAVTSFILIVEYRIGCGPWIPLYPNATIATYPIMPPFFFINVNPVQYQDCSTNPSKPNQQQDKMEMLLEHSFGEGEQTGTLERETKTQSSHITEMKGDQFIIFPNPTTGLVELRSEEATIEAVKVYDVRGALVTQKLNITDSNISIDLGKFPKGLYMVNIQTATTNETIRVVKE